MLNKYARSFATKVFTPLARLLLRLGVSPDAVSLLGVLGVTFGALYFYPRGELWWGSWFIAVFAVTDLVDGTMARTSGRTTSWGAFLDSTLDRIGDGAVFGGLILYFTGLGEHDLNAALALVCLILGFVTSYAKARAESLGFTANVGIAERADRLTVVLAATAFVGLFLPLWVLTVVLVLLAVASAVTVLQRILTVRTQALASTAGG